MSMWLNYVDKESLQIAKKITPLRWSDNSVFYVLKQEGRPKPPFVYLLSFTYTGACHCLNLSTN